MNLEVNGRRRLILKSLAAALAVMLLFPPFAVEGSGSTGGLGYAFLLDRPHHFVRVDSFQLLVQWLFAFSIAAIALVLAGDRDSCE